MSQAFSRVASSNLTQRIAAAIVAGPTVLFVNYSGGWAFRALIVAAAAVASMEAYGIIRRTGVHPAAPICVVMSATLALAPSLPHPAALWQGTIIVGLMAAAGWVLPKRRTDTAFLDWVLTVIIAIYTGGLLGALLAMRLMHNGIWLVLTVLVGTWAYDTGAYFMGRYRGRRPFMHHVSPSKTWEGVAGGALLTVAAMLLLRFGAGLSVALTIILACAVAIASQVGDLAESLLKRYAGAKDSGRIIPGHGGLLDRIDSLLFTGAAAYYILLLSGHR